MLANELMQSQLDSALAILSPKTRGGFTVSVRVTAKSPVGADEFCRTFDTGGGKKLSSRINHLPEADVDRFASSFEASFGTR